jgi:hypothetical protein
LPATVAEDLPRRGLSDVSTFGTEPETVSSGGLILHHLLSIVSAIWAILPLGAFLPYLSALYFGGFLAFGL